MSQHQPDIRRSILTVSLPSSRSGYLRKTVKNFYHEQQELEKTESESEQWSKLDELIRRRLAVLDLNEIWTKEVKLKSREQELQTKINQLSNLKNEFNRLQSENEQIKHELRRFQLLSQVLQQARDLEQFVKVLEPYCSQPIPLQLDDEQFQALFNTTRRHNERSEPLYENFNQIRDVLQSILDLNPLVDGQDAAVAASKIDVTKPETYQQFKQLNSKCNEQLKNLTDLPESIRNLKRIYSWLCSNSNSPKLMENF